MHRPKLHRLLRRGGHGHGGVNAMRVESEEYRWTVIQHSIYAVLAFLPRVFFGGAAFFSFFATRRADTRAMAA